jgi:glycosyltransferase involved in cell wall biosynthesis
MRLLVTTTLSPNQLRAHLGPIAAIPEVDEIVLVTDEQPPPLDKIVGVVPDARERRLVGRAGSKLIESARIARRMKPDWVLSYNIMPHAVNGLVAGRAGGSRTMYHMIGGETEWRGGGWASENAILGRFPRPVPAVERALLGLMRRTDVVCTMGTRSRSHVVAAGLDPSRVVVAPPAIDVERFSPDAGRLPRYDIVTAGRLVPAKRLHDFIAVVARLRRTRPEFRAAIAGTGPLEEELRADASRRRVADAIDFLGLQSGIEDVYRSTRIFLLTSAFEGLSVALGEALASGVPAVVTDVGDLRDLVHDGVNGFVCPAGDVVALAAAVDRLLDDAALYRDASAAARRVALERSIPHLTNLYRELLIEAIVKTGGAGA